MAEPVTHPRPVTETRDSLLVASRSALEVLANALSPLEQLGGAGDIRAQKERLERALESDQLVVELTGPQREQAIAKLCSVELLPKTLARGMTLTMRQGIHLDYEARMANGRRELAPADENPSLAVSLDDVERAIVEDTEKARRLSEDLQVAARSAAYARAHMAEVARDLTVLGRKTEQSALVKPVETSQLIVATPAQPKRRRRGFWGWILAFFRWLFGRPEKVLGSPLPPTGQLPVPKENAEEEFLKDESTLVAASKKGKAALEQRVAEEAARLAPTADAVNEIEGVLRELKAKLVDLGTERLRLRKELEAHHAERRNRFAARIRELAAEGAGSIDIAVPGVPEGVTLCVGDAAEADLRIRVDDPTADLAGRLVQLCANRTAELARLLTATLCGCRNRILDLDRRARVSHEEHVAETLARKMRQGEARHQQEEAQLAMGRHAEQIIQDANAGLEKLLADVRNAWEERIASCKGMEQLRAEVAAIESGASYRLQLVCDELREKITVSAVRVVLELSRPLRQELARRRIEIARGRATDVEENFENIRMKLPETMDATFGALAAPELGELLSTERGFLDPIFRTLAREKRQVTSRLRARLDEIEKHTVRELFAAAVYLSPLLLQAFNHVVDELASVHERWVDARVDELRIANEAERAQREPALAMIEVLEEKEQTLGRMLESVSGASVAPNR
jgi:hypothetical protein